MSATLMFWPMLAMAALTATAWAIMGRRRLAAVRARDMRLGDFSGTAEIAMSPAVSVSTRHFANHFEVPLLFHAICLAHIALAAGGWLALGAAWLFVVLRALHMREHLGRNDIMTRFNLYAASTALVWLLWLHLAGVLLLRG
jgi:hypothetical protein